MNDHTLNVKFYLPCSLLNEIDHRCKLLGIGRSEYLRLVAIQDITKERYNKYLNYIVELYEILHDIKEKLYLEN